MAAENRRWFVIAIVAMVIVNLALICHWAGISSYIALPIYLAGIVLFLAGVLKSRKTRKPDQSASTAKSDSDA
jgi:hypothetical protein